MQGMHEQVTPIWYTISFPDWWYWIPTYRWKSRRFLSRQSTEEKKLKEHGAGGAEVDLLGPCSSILNVQMPVGLSQRVRVHQPGPMMVFWCYALLLWFPDGRCCLQRRHRWSPATSIASISFQSFLLSPVKDFSFFNSFHHQSFLYDRSSAFNLHDIRPDKYGRVFFLVGFYAKRHLSMAHNFI